MSKWTEAPMSAEVREKLLGTHAASTRTALARLLATQPALSYNQCLTALKAAGKGNTFEGHRFLGAEEARRLLG